MVNSWINLDKFGRTWIELLKKYDKIYLYDENEEEYKRERKNKM